jgi:hypothetical protein
MAKQIEVSASDLLEQVAGARKRGREMSAVIGDLSSKEKVELE